MSARARLAAPALLGLAFGCAAPPPPPSSPPPAPPPWPMQAFDVPARGVVVAIAGPAGEGKGAPPFLRALQRELADRLAERVHLRLPEATLVLRTPGSVGNAREWLRAEAPRAVIGLRAERVLCADSRRAGRVAEGEIDVALVRPTDTDVRRIVVAREFAELELGSCAGDVVARLFEEVLAEPAVREALGAGAGPATAAWPAPVVRALFPGLDLVIDEWLDLAAAQMARGQVDEAVESYRQAARVDPDDLRVRSYLDEVEANLALRREIALLRERAAPAPGAAPGGAERATDPVAAGRTEDLLAALRQGGGRPDARELERFKAVVTPDPAAPGPRLARARVAGPVEARVVLSEDGEALATWYFPVGDSRPVLREEDESGDGRPDRWTAYGADGGPREVWEDRGGAGRPDFHAVFAPGGETLERVEVDADGDGRPEQIFAYQGGRLVSEAEDRNGDGRPERFEEFDPEGRVRLREEDLDGDGRIDVRSRYEQGRLVSREIEDPALLDRMERR